MTDQATATRDAIVSAPAPLAILQRVAAEHGATPAMIHRRHPTDAAPETWSYEACLSTARRLAGALRRRGIGTGDTVAIIAPSVPEMMVAFIAVTSIAVAFPINVMLSAEAIASQLALAQAKAVITYGRHPAFDLSERVRAAVEATSSVGFIVEFGPGEEEQRQPPMIRWDRFLEEGEPPVGASGPGERAAALFHTGGTTGAPKLAELSLSGLTAAAHMAAAGVGFRSSDRMLMLLPFFHVGGAIAAGLSLFCVGATLMTCGLAGGRNPELIKAIWSTAAAMDASVVCMVPSTWSIVATLPAPARWPAFRGMVTGATSMTPELAARLERLAGVPMSQVYGMSELSGIISGQPVDGVFRTPGVGRPVPLLNLRLAPIAAGGPNEVMIGSPNLFRGYGTSEGLVEQPVKEIASGDLGEIDGDGQLRLSGRSKDVIVRSGHNIDPLSIEDIASRHPDIVMSAAVGMPDAYAGEVPVLYVVAHDGSAIGEEDLGAFMTERIAEPPARPRRIFFVADLPMTPVGKIARYRLRQAAAAARAAEALDGLTPSALDCIDYGARVVSIHWPSDATADHRAEAEARLTQLGLRAVHRLGGKVGQVAGAPVRRPPGQRPALLKRSAICVSLRGSD